jgi:hypothetical protein
MESVGKEMFSGRGSQTVIDDTAAAGRSRLDPAAQDARRSLREMLISIQRFNTLNRLAAGPAGAPSVLPVGRFRREE